MYKLLLLLLSVQNVYCSNILFVSSIPSPSHTIWNEALAHALADKGHNVTFVSPDKNKLKLSNYHHILLEGIYETAHGDEGFNPNDLGSHSPLQLIFELQDFGIIFCSAIFESKGIQKLLNYSDKFKFDVIILDITAGSCLYPLIKKFNFPPTVGVTPFLLPSYIAFNFGGHMYPAYVPWHSFSYDIELGVIEKMWNFFYSYVEAVSKNLRQYKQEHELAKKLFGDDLPSMEKLERHITLILANTDPVLDIAQPLPPNIIPVGGLHTKESKQLPQDLQVILDSAKNGAIIFSLGSNVRSDKLDKHKQQQFIDAFSKIPQIVIWKFESEIENLPKNVIVRKWLPQNDLLGHPNVKLFIGHGGALSTQEAIFHGIPMICVPFFMDQFLNAKNIVNRRLGFQLDINNVTSDHLFQMLTEVLNNPQYTESTKKMSNRFRDRLETPLERGVFWIEYVIRHGGADFLNTAARNVSFFKSSGLDIIVYVLLLVALVFFVLSNMFGVKSKTYKNKKNYKKKRN